MDCIVGGTLSASLLGEGGKPWVTGVAATLVVAVTLASTVAVAAAVAVAIAADVVLQVLLL